MITKGARTRGRLVDSMLESIQVRGYAGTGLTAVLDHASAPKGSLYFHFPDGKESLGGAAVQLATEQFTELIATAAAEAPSTGAAIAHVIEALADLLTGSDYRLGCPVSVVTLEMGAHNDRLRTDCANAFATWIEAVTDRLVADGRSPAAALDLATMIVSTVEGAVIVSRAQRSVAPLRSVGAILAGLADAAPASSANGAAR